MHITAKSLEMHQKSSLLTKTLELHMHVWIRMRSCMSKKHILDLLYPRDEAGRRGNLGHEWAWIEGRDQLFCPRVVVPGPIAAITTSYNTNILPIKVRAVIILYQAHSTIPCHMMHILLRILNVRTIAGWSVIPSSWNKQNLLSPSLYE